MMRRAKRSFKRRLDRASRSFKRPWLTEKGVWWWNDCKASRISRGLWEFTRNNKKLVASNTLLSMTSLIVRGKWEWRTGDDERSAANYRLDGPFETKTILAVSDSAKRTDDFLNNKTFPTLRYSFFIGKKSIFIKRCRRCSSFKFFWKYHDFFSVNGCLEWKAGGGCGWLNTGVVDVGE